MVPAVVSPMELRIGLAGYTALANILGYAIYRLGLRRHIDTGAPMPARPIIAISLLGGAPGAGIAAVLARRIILRAPMKRVLARILVVQVAALLAFATPWSPTIDHDATKVEGVALGDAGQFAHEMATDGGGAPATFTPDGASDGGGKPGQPRSYWDYHSGKKYGAFHSSGSLF